jgi:HD-like signal output (HDOD) protein
MNRKTENNFELKNFSDKNSDLVSKQEAFSANMMIIDIEELVSEISELVSLPEVYLKIRELMDDPKSSINDFAIVVNTDPGLLALVLKIVNSAFYGFAGQIKNIKRAVNLIGIGQLHDLVLSLSAVDALELSNDIEELSTFWQRSIYCGVLARLIADKLHLREAGSLFTVGLLHEIGRLILFMKYPEESSIAVMQADKEMLSLTEVEKIIFGTDYSKLGQALMEEWNLPIKFQRITEYHTTPEKATEYILETYILYVAHMAAVNKFSGADCFQYLIDQDILVQIKTNEEEMNILFEEANDISLEMERMILG